MKNLKLFLSVIFVVLLFNSCENEEDLFIENPDKTIEITAKDTSEFVNRGPTITFGRYYGKCLGKGCIDVFKLIDVTLLEDTLDMYPASGTFYQGKFTNFIGADKINTSDILPNFPLELLKSKLITYGTPDAGDWGGLYLEYQDGVDHRYWFLDLKVENNPRYLRTYIALIDKKITEIGEINDLN